MSRKHRRERGADPLRLRRKWRFIGTSHVQPRPHGAHNRRRSDRKSDCDTRSCREGGEQFAPVRQRHPVFKRRFCFRYHNRCRVDFVQRSGCFTDSHSPGWQHSQAGLRDRHLREPHVCVFVARTWSHRSRMGPSRLHEQQDFYCLRRHHLGQHRPCRLSRGRVLDASGRRSQCAVCHRSRDWSLRRRTRIVWQPGSPEPWNCRIRGTSGWALRLPVRERPIWYCSGKCGDR